MVHPNKNAQENLQIYGSPGHNTSMDILVRQDSFLETPSAEEIFHAQSALASYQNAVAAGNVDAAYKLTSSLSFGWSPNRSEFLLHGWLRPITESVPVKLDAAHALLMVNRSAVAALVAVNSGVDRDSDANTDATIKEIAQYPNWVFIARLSHDRVVQTSVLRKEHGQWRVVTVPDVPGINLAAAVEGRVAGKVGDLNQITDSLSPAEQETALRVGKTFLQLWAADEQIALLGMAHLVPGASSEAKQFETMLAARSDEGICPLDASEAISLHPINGLSSWDFAQILGVHGTQFGSLSELMLPGTSRGITPVFDGLTPNTVKPPSQPSMVIATLQYSNAMGRKFLMLLAKNEKSWRVIEPALPR